MKMVHGRIQQKDLCLITFCELVISRMSNKRSLSFPPITWVMSILSSEKIPESNPPLTSGLFFDKFRLLVNGKDKLVRCFEVVED